jgi:hypothetical protein
VTKDDAKQAHALVSLYINLYKVIYGKAPTMNRYREKWAMQDVLDSVGYERAKELLEYYFKTPRTGHPLNWFLYNFDKLDIYLTEYHRDKDRREMIRMQTKAMVEENNEH